MFVLRCEPIVVVSVALKLTKIRDRRDGSELESHVVGGIVERQIYDVPDAVVGSLWSAVHLIQYDVVAPLHSRIKYDLENLAF